MKDKNSKGSNEFNFKIKLELKIKLPTEINFRKLKKFLLRILFQLFLFLQNDFSVTRGLGKPPKILLCVHTKAVRICVHTKG